MGKILIVEDDRSSRKILAEAVEGMGHVAIQVSNGLKAVFVLDDNPDTSLVITDVMMPEMDGPELIRILRGIERFATIPVIIISAVVNERGVRDLITLGAARVLTKPVKIPLLREFLDQLIGQPLP